MPDMEDKEGETAVHKAALNGHLKVVQYLLPVRADVHCQDADGWTALHNACSKGYLDIVRWLCESGGAAEDIDGTPGVDVRSKGGYTPLSKSKTYFVMHIYSSPPSSERSIEGAPACSFVSIEQANGQPSRS
jgi:ankyrin repeat protein